MAGVVFKMKFTEPSSFAKYSGFLKYIDRPEAIGQVDDLRKYDVFGTYMDYMGNPEKSTGLFMGNTDIVTPEMKDQIKELADQAESNGALLHQMVISFESSWLQDTGIMNEEGAVDEAKLREYTRKSVKKMLDKEGMSDTIWTAAIHKNTEHVHIHVAMFDPKPYWEPGKGRCRTRDNGKVYQRGVIKQSTINMGKSTFINSAMEMSQANKDINDIVRNVILSEKTTAKIRNSGNRTIEKKFQELLESLPEDRRLWRYNMNAMDEYRDIIDDISMEIIKEYYSEEYRELQGIWKENYELYKNSYGDTERADKYIDNQVKDLKSRLGNRILSECRAVSFDMQRRSEQIHQSKQLDSKHAAARAKLNARRDFSRAAANLRKFARKDMESMKNQAIYNRLNKETDIEDR